MSSSRPFYHLCTRCANTRAASIPLRPQRLSESSTIRFLSSTSPGSYAVTADLPRGSSAEDPPEITPTSATPSQPITTPLTTPTSRPELHTLPKSHILRAPRNQHQPASTTLFTGHVTRTSTMPRTVQVTRNQQVWDKFLQKHYQRPHRALAHLPDELHYPGAIREGDVVEYGTFNAEEQQAKIDKEKQRIELKVAKLLEEESAKASAEGRPDRGMNSKAIRRYLREIREEKEYAKGGGRKVRGVKFVVRRVVTPFGAGMESRVDGLNIQ